MCGRSVWKQPACNGKNTPTHFYNRRKIINSLSERAVWNSPSVHVTEGKKSRPFTFMHLADTFIQSDLQLHSGYTFFISICVPWESNPESFALLTQCSTTEPQEHLWRCPVRIDTALSEKLWSASAITFTCCSCWRYTMSAPKRLFKCLFWDALTNIGVSIDSPHLSRWGHCGYVSLSKEMSQKKLKKVPNTCRDQYQCFVQESLLQTKYDAFVFQIAFLKELLGTL